MRLASAQPMRADDMRAASLAEYIPRLPTILFNETDEIEVADQRRSRAVNAVQRTFCSDCLSPFSLTGTATYCIRTP